jgi:hypothetical protein
MSTQEIIKIDALRLLTAFRFDIMAKYIYASNQIKKINSSWAEKLYKEHLRVLNNFYEKEPAKNCFKDFKEAFDKIIDTIGKSGFDSDKSLIPIAPMLSPLNGAHRLAACLAHQKEISGYITNERSLGLLDCSSYLLRNKRNIVPTGLEEKWADPMALQYARLKPSCYVLCFFSQALTRENEVDEILMKYGLPVYEKTLTLNEHGQINLMRTIYKNESWLGSVENYFSGCRAKAKCCFPENGDMKVVLFDALPAADMVKMKKEIRTVFNIEKDSIHINDTYQETLEMSELFFNNNSVIVNNCLQRIHRIELNKNIRKLKRLCRRQNIELSSICVTGPAILAVHGIHDVSEFILLSQIKAPADYKCINSILNNKFIDELIYNPDNYLYYNGVKFLTLENEQKVGILLQEAQKEERQKINALIQQSGIHDDLSATTFCEAHLNCGVSILWSNNDNENSEILKNLAAFTDIIYRQKIHMSQEALENFLLQNKQINLKDFKNFNGSIEIVLFNYDQQQLSQLNPQKNCYLPELETIHEESLNLVHILLNKNSRHFLEFARPSSFELFDKHLDLFKTWAQENNISLNDCCFDNGSILAAYGLRDSYDLDFLYNGLYIDTEIDRVDCNNFLFQEFRETIDLPYKIDQVIYNPENHFYYKGFKFYKLEILEYIKERRLVNGNRREKDISDFNSIKALKNRTLQVAS